MARLFGTDGVRGIALKELSIELTMKIGYWTAKLLKKDQETITLLIGSDTRISKDVLKFALVSGVLSAGVNVIDLGIIPTPAVAYLIKKYHVDGGFVISASHNPSEYNGIKVLDKNGFKLDEDLELELENAILDQEISLEDDMQIGSYTYEHAAKEDYVNYLLSTIDGDLSNLRIGIDVANGAAYQTASMLFSKLNINYEIINNNPDGYNINENAGSTHMENLQKLVVANHLDCGIAYDGDADRCLMVDDVGNIVSGDEILAICSLYLKEKGQLSHNAIVGTIMSNLGLSKFCDQENITFEATKVGDKYVLQKMLNDDFNLGGEQSGHIIFKDYATTGDGELTSLQVLNIMAKKGQKLSVLKQVMDVYPQVLKNLKVSKKSKANYVSNQKISDCIEKCNQKLRGEGRILVRPSGTENLIRVMVEGKDLTLITKICDEIITVMKKELK